MDKTTRIEYRRFFLMESLPDTLTREGRHVQLFDNYIPNTRMRIRRLRVPETKTWSWELQQRIWEPDRSNLICEVAAMSLTEAEHAAFAHFEGSEVRKNRYSLTLDGSEFAVDIYLGDLLGLYRASVGFESAEEATEFVVPGEEFLDVTGDVFFRDENLVTVNLADVRTAVAKMLAQTKTPSA